MLLCLQQLILVQIWMDSKEHLNEETVYLKIIIKDLKIYAKDQEPKAELMYKFPIKKLFWPYLESCPHDLNSIQLYYRPRNPGIKGKMPRYDRGCAMYIPDSFSFVLSLCPNMW